MQGNIDRFRIETEGDARRCKLVQNRDMGDIVGFRVELYIYIYIYVCMYTYMYMYIYIYVYI